VAGRREVSLRVLEVWQIEELPAGATGEPLLDLAWYLLNHSPRLGYASRLADGWRIGSGLVEGSIKQFVNRRLKQTGRSGRLPMVDRWWDWRR
jgi:hypothetical protein